MKTFLLCCTRRILPVVFLFAAHVALAQQLEPAPWNDPAITWLLPVQAQAAVEGKLVLLDDELGDQAPGSNEYTEVLRRIVFYKSILHSLSGGATVLQAIDAAPLQAASLGGAYELASASEATLRDLYEEALALLSN